MKQLLKNINKTINFKILINFILSLMATTGIIKIYEIYGNSSLSNTSINLIIFTLFFVIFNSIKKAEKNEIIFTIVFSLFLSTIVVIGTQLEIYSEIIWSFVTLLKILLLCVSIIPFIIKLLNFIENCKLNNIKKSNFKKLYIITFTIIFISGLLVFLALYPGLYGYDAGYQIMQILNEDTQLTSHFSILFCYLLAGIVNLGKILFNNYQVGFAIYCFLQMLFLSYVSSKITIYVIRKTNNIYIYLLSLVFFSIFPLYTVMAVSACQDSIFAGLFALIVLNFLEIVETKDYWQKKHKPIILSFLILLLCLIRNNGLYCILIPILLTILFCKNKKIITLLVLIIPLILYKVFTGPIYDLLDIKKTDTFREMLSVPSQQLARVYNYNYDVFSKKELKQLNNYYDKIENFKYYSINQSIADQSKGALNNDEVKKDLFGYIKLWGKIGTKDPENYIEAFLLNSLGFWYPNKNYYDYRMYHPYIEIEMLDGPKWNEKYLDIKRESKFPIYLKVLNITLNKNSWTKVPVISTLFTAGTYFILVLFLLGLYITLFLSPVALFRYSFPIAIILPIIISLIFTQKNRSK